MQSQKKDNKGLTFGIVGLIAGLLGLLVSPSLLVAILRLFDGNGLVCGTMLASFALGVVAIILGTMALQNKSKIGIAGIILGILAILSVFAPVAYVFFAPM